MQFGHYTECFEVSFSGKALERLADAAANALRELRAKAAEEASG
ncbi:hypothetical protein ACFPM7_26565 [Actinokineospora guangxiensis]|uniref:Uncharacterized protein n=1 Tax=Actinokineospora guangxiensis TaxID=1490288 RepID=A0ABW0ET83_9PSEU